MENFRFENKTQIYFGKGRHKETAEYIKPLANKVLIVYGSNRIKKSGVFDEIISDFNQNQIEYFELSGVTANPKLSKVREGVEFCRKNDINFLLAVGGGSVIDTAKAIVLGLSGENDVWDYYSKTATIHEVKASLAVVLTIPGSGSEASASTVLTNDYMTIPEKLDYTSNSIRPVFAILNPELAMTLSWEQIACAGIDMLAHVMERYFTKVKNVELTDRLCEATMITIINDLRKIKDEGINYDAMAELMWASTIAHSNILSTGRRSDWASHMIEHEISARFNIAHGDGLAMIIPSWMRYVYKNHIDIFAQFAQRVWNCTEINTEKLAELGIEKTINFYRQLGKETSMFKLCISDNELEQMAEHICKSGTIGDIEKLDSKDILQILRMAT